MAQPDLNRLTPAVLAWGQPRLRELPWRRTRDPWAVLVSEVMLQQTQVSRVIVKWHEFVEAWPTPADCAHAPLADVLRVWQGLGYPRRARNLHLAATAIAESGRFPDTLDGLLALPGVGPYTARAVLAFAFEADAAVVDTNIARVYARLAGRSLTLGEVQALADEALPQGDSWAWNQCLMDLGAVLCRPQRPACDECAAAELCEWRGGPADDPAIGSGGVSGRQARFDGSDRQARGNLLRALDSCSIHRDDVAVTMQRSQLVADRLVEALALEGLVTVVGHTVVLGAPDDQPL